MIHRTTLDDVAGLARRLLDADAVVISTTLDGEHTVMGVSGVEAEVVADAPCPLVHELGRHVLIDDVADEPLLRDQPLVRIVGIRSIAATPLVDEHGHTVGALCIGCDEPRRWTAHDLQVLVAVAGFVGGRLTQARDTAVALDRAQELTQVLGALRHDLGSELSVVLGGIETALHPNVPAHIRDRALDRARHDARRVLSTLDALMHTDRQQPVVRSASSLGEIVDDALDEVATPLSGRLLLDITDAPVLTDGPALGRIIANLVDNALLHTDELVVVSAGVEGRDVIVAVHDCGPGLTTEVEQQLCAGAGSAGPTPGERGTFGLGLYIVRELTARLGGNVSIVSSPAGSSIVVQVPAGR